MSGVRRVYTIFDHPFIMSFEGIFLGVNGRMGSAEDRVFENTVSSAGHSESGGFGVSEFVGAAGGSFQSDPTIFPEFTFGLESVGGIEISQKSQGSDGTDAGQLLPLFDHRLGASKLLEVFSGQFDLPGRSVQSDPKGLQLAGQSREILVLEPSGTVLRIFDDTGGDVQSKAARVGTNTADLTGTVLDAAMVKTDPLLQIDPAVVLAVMDRPEKTTP